MKYIKTLALISILSFTGCTQYDVIQHQKIKKLQELSQALKQQQDAAKERFIQYKAKNNTTGMLQTGKIIGITKGSTTVIDDATDNAKPITKFIFDKGVQGITPFAPLLGPYAGLLEGALALAGLLGTGFGAKKGHEVITRRKRIKQAVISVKNSPIGGEKEFNPCDPQIISAMQLYLSDNDFKVWKQSHGC